MQKHSVGGGNGRISLPGTLREQAKRELCLCVLTAEHDAWCEHLYYGDIMKVNLLNTKFIIVATRSGSTPCQERCLEILWHFSDCCQPVETLSSGVNNV